MHYHLNDLKLFTIHIKTEIISPRNKVFYISYKYTFCNETRSNRNCFFPGNIFCQKSTPTSMVTSNFFYCCRRLFCSYICRERIFPFAFYNSITIHLFLMEIPFSSPFYTRISIKKQKEKYHNFSFLP
jgi:hypothetical protein